MGNDMLGVIMPVFNEVATLDAILERVLAQACVAEVLAVDDASTDGSWPCLQTWPSRDHRVRLARHERNRGKGAAIRTALAQLTAPLVLIQDADLEYDPADYPRLLAPILEGRADVVYGSRFLSGANANPFWHTWGNRWLTWAANRLTGLRLTDEATCYKLMGRERWVGLGLVEEGFGFCPEVTAKVARRGLRVVEVPVSYHGRGTAAGKKIRWRDGWWALRCLYRYSRKG